MAAPPPLPAPDRPPQAGWITAAGVISIVFASLGFCCGGWQLVSIYVMPMFFDLANQAQRRASVEAQALKDANVARLEDARAKADEAGDAARVAELDRDLAAARAAPVPLAFPSGVDAGGVMRDPTMRLYNTAGAGLGFFTNALLLAAGIGIVRRRRWGRTLGIGAAGVKIVGEGGMLAAYLVVMPGIMARYGAGMSRDQQLFSTIGTVFGIAVATAWPAILLLVLFSRRAREEFVAGPRA